MLFVYILNRDQIKSVFGLKQQIAQLELLQKLSRYFVFLNKAANYHSWVNVCNLHIHSNYLLCIYLAIVLNVCKRIFSCKLLTAMVNMCKINSVVCIRSSFH